LKLKINHLQHIGIPVTDLNRSEKFYVQLGFSKVMAAGFDHKGGKGRVAMMQQGDILLEIYQMPQQELAAIKNRQDGHVDHIAFDVDDIDAAFRELKEASFHILEEEPVYLPFWEKGCRYFNITGPDGERLEFNQIIKT
jgi:catechol 2,3-dioxygenase-like lactoylglutathione lyase family enzyme